MEICVCVCEREILLESLVKLEETKYEWMQNIKCPNAAKADRRLCVVTFMYILCYS